MEREDVYECINEERAYQENLDFEHKGYPSVAEEILLLEHYIANVRSCWVINKGNEAALDAIRKVAGISVRCLENHGCPTRNRKQ